MYFYFQNIFKMNIYLPLLNTWEYIQIFFATKQNRKNELCSKKNNKDFSSISNAKTQLHRIVACQSSNMQSESRAHNFASAIYSVYIQKPSEANTLFVFFMAHCIYMCARENLLLEQTVIIIKFYDNQATTTTT